MHRKYLDVRWLLRIPVPTSSRRDFNGPSGPAWKTNASQVNALPKASRLAKDSNQSVNLMSQTETRMPVDRIATRFPTNSLLAARLGHSGGTAGDGAEAIVFPSSYGGKVASSTSPGWCRRLLYETGMLCASAEPWHPVSTAILLLRIESISMMNSKTRA